MRILHVVATGERRGAELFAADLIRELTSAGVNQQVAVVRGSPPFPAAYEAEAKVLSGRPLLIPGLRIDGRAVLRLRALCRRLRPHIIQAHGGEPLKYAAMAAGSSGARLVYRRIGLSPDRAQRGVARMGHRTLMSRCQQIIAVAEAVRRETIEGFGISPDRVVTIPRGVDRRRIRSVQGRMRARARMGIPQEAPVVLSLGALSWEKDPLGQLEIMNSVRRAVPGSVHLIAGEGPLRGDVERRILALALDGLARVLGSRSDVPDLLVASDVVLLASRVEGMPGCLIEAGMASVPVAAYAVAGVPEVVIDGDTGYTVKPGDAAGLAERTIRLLEDPALRDRMGALARDRCERLFDMSAIARRYLTVYEEVLA
jgi:glycosyltransferase involved in cell wall biosynthesis